LGQIYESLCNFLLPCILLPKGGQMAAQFQICIDNPCSQLWEWMTPGALGCFCAACQKTVRDFSGMSDGEVLRALATGRAAGAVAGTCGRFLPGQLNRVLLPEAVRKGRRFGWWQYLLAGLLFSSEVSAQLKTGADTVHVRLVDSGNNPVSFATIMLRRGFGYQVDADGRVTIPRSALSGIDSVTVSGVGYATIRVAASSLADGKDKIIAVAATVLGKFEVVAVRRKHRRFWVF
jgi:hypothetical protein